MQCCENYRISFAISLLRETRAEHCHTKSLKKSFIFEFKVRFYILIMSSFLLEQLIGLQ
jgi:hypothetical protein